MPHHGSEPDPELILQEKLIEADDEIKKKLDVLQAQHEALGATGKYPHGKLAPSDEGEIAFRVGSNAGKVVIEFGKPVAWLGLNPSDARDLAALLAKHAENADA